MPINKRDRERKLVVGTYEKLSSNSSSKTHPVISIYFKTLSVVKMYEENMAFSKYMCALKFVCDLNKLPFVRKLRHY